MFFQLLIFNINFLLSISSILFIPDHSISIIVLKFNPVVIIMSSLAKLNKFLNDFLFDFCLLLMKLTYLCKSILLRCRAPVRGSNNYL